MTSPGPHHPRTSNYGLGLEIQQRDYRTTTWGHGGFLPGFRSTLRYLPDADLLVVALVNDSRADADDLAELAYRGVAASDLPDPPIRSPGPREPRSPGPVPEKSLNSPFEGNF